MESSGETVTETVAELPPGTVTEMVELALLPDSASAWAGPATETRPKAAAASPTMEIRMQCLFTSFPQGVVSQAGRPGENEVRNTCFRIGLRPLLSRC